jgi:hypothetical protein
MTWVLIWAMMWEMGTMTATMPATTLAKGMAGMPARRGWGDPGGGRGSGSDCVGGGGCILLGSIPFYWDDIFVWYFYVWEELARSHISSHSHHA